MGVLGELRACAFNVRLLLIRLSDKLVEVGIQLDPVLVALLGVEEVLCKFGGRAGLIRDTGARNACIGICYRDKEVGRRLTIGRLVPVMIAYI